MSKKGQFRRAILWFASEKEQEDTTLWDVEASQTDRQTPDKYPSRV